MLNLQLVVHRTCTCAEAGTRLMEGHQLAHGQPSDGMQMYACEHTHGRVRLGILASRSMHLARLPKRTLQSPPRGAQPPAPFATSPHKGTRATLKNLPVSPLMKTRSGFPPPWGKEHEGAQGPCGLAIPWESLSPPRPRLAGSAMCQSSSPAPPYSPHLPNFCPSPGPMECHCAQGASPDCPG